MTDQQYWDEWEKRFKEIIASVGRLLGDHVNQPYKLPLSADCEVTMQMPRSLSSAQWHVMMTQLRALKPGLVSNEETPMARLAKLEAAGQEMLAEAQAKIKAREGES